MITEKDAYYNLSKKQSNMMMVSLVNYDRDYYVAQFSGNTPSFDDPYYAINKSTGKIVGFVPDDLEEYLDALENRSVDISKYQHNKTMNNNYLEHHGILGQKWGIRRFQNYDGSYTEAGKDRYGRSDSDRKKLATQMKNDIATVKSLTWQERKTKSPFAESSDPNRWVRRVKKGTIYDDIHKSLGSARVKFEKTNKVISDYWNNDKLVKKYQKKAAKIAWEEFGDDTEESLKEYEWAYMYDDLDQGPNNSFKVYCDEKGLNYNEIQKNRYESFKQYEKACADAVSEILGSYGDEVLEKEKRFTFGQYTHVDPEKTIASEVGKIIANIDDDEFYRRGIFTVD